MGSREARGRETGRLNSEPVRETESSERTGERQTDRQRHRERERINKPKLDVVPQPFSEPAIRSITRAITRVCAGKYWARILRVHYWQNVPNSCSPA